MSKVLPIPAAIRSLSYLLPVLALIQLALGALLMFNAMWNLGKAGNPAGYIGAVLGFVMIVSAFVMIAAIFALRRRSRAMRNAVTASCLITIGIAIMVLIEVLIAYNAGVAGESVTIDLAKYLPPLLAVFGLPVAVLTMLWAAPSTRAFFRASPARV